MIRSKNDNKKINSIINIISQVKKKSSKITYLHDPSLDYKDIKYISKSIKERQVSTYGRFTNIFEKKIKNYTKSNNVISTINGTAALHISLILANVNQNDEVIVSTLGFISSVNVISYLKATPHFVDCEEDTLGIDPIKLENYLKKNTFMKNTQCINKKNKKVIRAMIVTHMFGYPCKINKILSLTKKFNIKLIEDSAEALGSWYKNKHLGTFGEFGVLSFNGNKIATTGGGGAILIRNNKLAKKALKLTKNMKVKKKYEQIFDGVGYNYRLPSLNSALGCSQIDKIRIFLKKKRILHNFYKNKFKRLKFIRFLSEIKGSKSNQWLQTIILNKGHENLKNTIIKKTNLKNIQTRPVWKLLHKMKIYKNCQKMNLNNAISLEKRIINIPSSQNLI